jgi:hypothetical protein
MKKIAVRGERARIVEANGYNLIMRGVGHPHVSQPDQFVRQHQRARRELDHHVDVSGGQTVTQA